MFIVFAHSRVCLCVAAGVCVCVCGWCVCACVLDGGLCVNRYRRCMSNSGSLCHGGLNMAMEPGQACSECHEALAELISIVCEWYECHGVRTCANCMRAMTCWLDLYRSSIRILTCNSLTNMRAFTHTHTHHHHHHHTYAHTHTHGPPRSLLGPEPGRPCTRQVRRLRWRNGPRV